ncbi:MAG: hypothetical protein OEY64_13185 [Nitrospinota bacterium]|nr:hypothetical protein [Nitrospinota bacterium]
MRKLLTLTIFALALSLVASPALMAHAKEKAGKTCCGGMSKEQCKIEMGDNCPLDMSEKGDADSKGKSKGKEIPADSSSSSKKGKI